MLFVILQFRMLYLENLTVTQFKNYPQETFSFREKIVSITGPNGVGKTNLLDAIHYLCFTKSYFSKNDQQNVLKDSSGFRIEGKFISGAEEKNVTAVLRETGKKEFSFDGDNYLKFSHHIGKLPCVMVAPDDIEIITDGSERRRRFLDTLLSQLDAAYLENLISYNKVLQQRNGLFRNLAQNNNIDFPLLQILNNQLAGFGETVHTKRKDFLLRFNPIVKEIYHEIADNREEISISYDSQLNETKWPRLFEQYFEKDKLLQRTNGGTHKDDLLIKFNGSLFKEVASQGQRKSLLFALKLAEFEILKKAKGFAPILLLDDIFEKLDDKRMEKLLDRICRPEEGQIFITDTHKERIMESFERLHVPFQLIELK